MITKKDIFDSVINDPLYKFAFKNLSDDQKQKINEMINNFIDNFSMKILSGIKNKIDSDKDSIDR